MPYAYVIIMSLKQRHLQNRNLVTLDGKITIVIYQLSHVYPWQATCIQICIGVN